MRNVSPRIVLCNGADLPQQWAQYEPLVLEYREIAGAVQKYQAYFCAILLVSVLHLPDRVLDLLEIAAMSFVRIGLISRGSRANLEYHSWARSFHFAIKVRDFEFWNTFDVKEKLKAALVFMSGDRMYHFTFQPGHSTPQADMFDKRTFQS